MASSGEPRTDRQHRRPSAFVSLLFGAYLGEILRHGEAQAGWTDGITEEVSGE